MRAFLLSLIITIASPIAAFCNVAPDAVPERLVGFCGGKAASPEDIAFLRSQTELGGASECLARALLFRFEPSKEADQFRKYFAVDRRASQSVVPSNEINQKVNGLLQEYKGRHPAEQMARVYLAFRGGRGVFRKADGSDLDLEVMFRGSVFAAVSGGAKEEMFRLASEADKNIQPNQAPEPTPTSVTPPAGQEARQP